MLYKIYSFTQSFSRRMKFLDKAYEYVKWRAQRISHLYI